MLTSKSSLTSFCSDRLIPWCLCSRSPLFSAPLPTPIYPRLRASESGAPCVSCDPFPWFCVVQVRMNSVCVAVLGCREGPDRPPDHYRCLGRGPLPCAALLRGPIDDDVRLPLHRCDRLSLAECAPPVIHGRPRHRTVTSTGRARSRTPEFASPIRRCLQLRWLSSSTPPRPRAEPAPCPGAVCSSPCS